MAIGEGNTRLNVVISDFDLLQLKIWSKVHGKTPSAYAAQIVASRIESNLALIDELATRLAAAQGISKEELIESLSKEGAE